MQTTHNFSLQMDNATAFGSFYKEMVEKPNTTYCIDIPTNNSAFQQFY